MTNTAHDPDERCPNCGRVVPKSTRHGLCRACLVTLAVDPISLQVPVGSELPAFIGPYVLLQEIGRGGMGVVWSARDTVRDRVVAVKMLLGGGFNAREAKERLRREGKAVEALKNPHIVAVHEVGEQDGVPFVAMDLVDGSDLSRVLQRGLPDPAQAAKWLIALASALSHAHANGIIHRDIKPANILIDSSGKAYLTDFGLAKIVDSGDYLTMTGQAVGSASFMAPEQASGQRNGITPAVDVYALGAVLYCLLTGRPPFVAESMVGVLKHVTESDPVPPWRVVASVPRALGTICLKCLEKAPGNRYKTAAELAEDLRKYLDGEPIAARNRSPLERTSRAIRRNPAIAALTTFLLVAACVFAVTAIKNRNKERSLAVQNSGTRQQLSLVSGWKAQGEAEKLYNPTRTAPAIAAFARIISDNPSNSLACARLFKILSGPLPWPVLPPLSHDAEVRYGEVSSNGQWIVTAATDGWAHVWSATSALHLLKVPHDTTRGRFALSGPGTRLATLDPDGSAAVRQLPEGSLLSRLSTPPGETGVITSALFAPDGLTVVTAGSDGHARIWGEDGHQSAALNHGEPVRTAQFDASAHTLVTVSETKARTWTNSGSTWLPTIAYAADSNTVAAFSPQDGALLLTEGKNLRIFEPHTGALLRAAASPGYISQALFDERGTSVMFADPRRRSFVWNGTGVRELPRHDGRITSIDYRAGGVLLSSDTFGEAHRVFTRTRRETLPRIKHRGSILEARYDSTKRMVLTVSSDRTARLNYVHRPSRAESVLPQEVKPVLFALSPNGTYVARADESDSVQVFSTRDPRADRPLIEHLHRITRMTFSPTETWLASADASGKVILSDAESRSTRRETLDHAGEVKALEWHLDDLFVTTPHGVTVWRVGQETTTKRFEVLLTNVLTSDLSRSGNALVIGTELGFSHVYDARTAALLGTPGPHPGPVTNAVLSSNGERLVTITPHGVARIWSTRDDQNAPRLLSPEGMANCVAFSPNSKSLLVGCTNGAVQLWNAEQGTLLREFARGKSPVISLDVSSDGKTVALGEANGDVRVFDFASRLAYSPGEPFESRPAVTFSAEGRRLLIIRAKDGATVYKLPQASMPAPAEVLMMAETQLMQRLDPQGVWRDLTREEFFERQRLLRTKRLEFGPWPQIRTYR